MLDVANIGNHSLLSGNLSATDTTMRLNTGVGAQFNVAPGNHFDLTIRKGADIERVRVTGRSGDTLSITRGMDGTTPRAWSAGACLTVEWSPGMLCEYIKNCVAGAPTPSGVTPGTYCMSTCSCLTIGSDGRITAIEQPNNCA